VFHTIALVWLRLFLRQQFRSVNLNPLMIVDDRQKNWPSFRRASHFAGCRVNVSDYEVLA
jgi:hypothetical protein